MSLLDLFRKKPSSGNQAKERLQFVLVSDRNQCSPDMMDAIRRDIIDVLSKYMDIDMNEIDIKLSNEDVSGTGKAVPTLYANIPIKDVKRNGGL